MRRWILRIVLVIVALFLALQLVPVDRANPPVVADFSGDEAVEQVLRRACYDCHSNETVWPWYSAVAPVSFLCAHDVAEGRAALNFSTWGAHAASDRAHARRECWEEVVGGHMPLPIYLWTHPEAVLTEGDRELLTIWAGTAPLAGHEDDHGPDHD